MVMDWEAALLGFSLGVPVNLLFFVGLAWSVRLALRSTRPSVLLLLSFLCRLALLLIAGFWLLSIGDNAWPMLGYAMAFFLVRVAAVLLARTSLIPASAEQERV